MLLSAHVERVSVSHMRDFFYYWGGGWGVNNDAKGVFNWYRCFYPHQSRELVSPVCEFFLKFWMYLQNWIGVALLKFVQLNMALFGWRVPIHKRHYSINPWKLSLTLSSKIAVGPPPLSIMEEVPLYLLSSNHCRPDKQRSHHQPGSDQAFELTKVYRKLLHKNWSWQCVSFFFVSKCCKKGLDPWVPKQCCDIKPANFSVTSLSSQVPCDGTFFKQFWVDSDSSCSSWLLVATGQKLLLLTSQGSVKWSCISNSKLIWQVKSYKRDVGNAKLDTKGKIVLALFSVCNKQMGVSWLL